MKHTWFKVDPENHKKMEVPVIQMEVPHHLLPHLPAIHGHAYWFIEALLSGK